MLLAGALVMLAPWPYTLLVIKPVNDTLNATEPERSRRAEPSPDRALGPPPCRPHGARRAGDRALLLRGGALSDDGLLTNFPCHFEGGEKPPRPQSGGVWQLALGSASDLLGDIDEAVTVRHGSGSGRWFCRRLGEFGRGGDGLRRWRRSGTFMRS